MILNDNFETVREKENSCNHLKADRHTKFSTNVTYYNNNTKPIKKETTTSTYDKIIDNLDILGEEVEGIQCIGIYPFAYYHIIRGMCCSSSS